MDAWIVIRELFYDFFGKAKPNPAHKGLAQLEDKGIPEPIKKDALNVQNILKIQQKNSFKIKHISLKIKIIKILFFSTLYNPYILITINK